MHLFVDTVDQYVEFAEHATGSPTFQSWAEQVADDPEVLAWLDQLPVTKRQPNLVLAAARWHGVAAPGPYAALRTALLEDDGTIIETIRRRATQTNEVGRLATLLPVFDLVAEAELAPLALLEIGASAGLCLFPDRYDYEWTGERVGQVLGRLSESGGPVLRCQVRGDFTPPTQRPVLAWRAGLDLNPLDVHDVDAMAWLENLVWPEHEDRRQTLREAVAVAQEQPSPVRIGDLLTDLPDLVEEASAYGSVVVFNSAVLAYVEPVARAEFAQTMTGLVERGACHWVSNESPHVLASVTATGPQVPTNHRTFVQALDGRVVAWTQPHGRAMRWFGPDDELRRRLA